MTRTAYQTFELLGVTAPLVIPNEQQVAILLPRSFVHDLPPAVLETCCSRFFHPRFLYPRQGGLGLHCVNVNRIAKKKLLISSIFTKFYGTVGHNLRTNRFKVRVN